MGVRRHPTSVILGNSVARVKPTFATQQAQSGHAERQSNVNFQSIASQAAQRFMGSQPNERRDAAEHRRSL